MLLSPLSVWWGIAHALAWLWWDVLRLRRFTVYKNLTIAFPEWTKEEKKRVARQSLVYFCFQIPSFFFLGGLRLQDASRIADFEGLENFERAQAKGKGVLWLTLHLGPGDLAMSLLALRGLPLHLISKRFRSEALTELWFAGRKLCGSKFIDPHGPRNAFQILSALRAKESVIFVLDQYMGRPFGVPTLFFGRRTGTAYGLALFSLKTNAPVVPVYCYWNPQGRLIVRFEPEVEVHVESGVERELQLIQMTQRYTDVLEAIVRRYPEQWMWIHRRWKGIE